VLDGLDHLDAGRRDVWRTRIDEAHGRDPREYQSNNGWVVAAFQAAFAAITSTAVPSPPAAACGHLADALRLAARSGNDTDTVAAIAGSLLGARWGGTAVPLSWRRVLHGRRTYDEPPCGPASSTRWPGSPSAVGGRMGSAGRASRSWCRTTPPSSAPVSW
jgi:hypothetical protein